MKERALVMLYSAIAIVCIGGGLLYGAKLQDVNCKTGDVLVRHVGSFIPVCVTPSKEAR